jgi:hypothetical protein
MKHGTLVGVCIVNRPVNLFMDNDLTLEVARLCTDGTPNACSFLLSRAARAAKALGYRRIQTYTLADEAVKSGGASLRAAGWLFSHVSKGGTWNTPLRKCSGLHSNRARTALYAPCRPTFAATITPRGTGFVAPETALMCAGLHSIATGLHSLPLTAPQSSDQPHHCMLPTVWMKYTLIAQDD